MATAVAVVRSAAEAAWPPSRPVVSGSARQPVRRAAAPPDVEQVHHLELAAVRRRIAAPAGAPGSYPRRCGAWPVTVAVSASMSTSRPRPPASTTGVGQHVELQRGASGAGPPRPRRRSRAGQTGTAGAPSPPPRRPRPAGPTRWSPATISPPIEATARRTACLRAAPSGGVDIGQRTLPIGVGGGRHIGQAAQNLGQDHPELPRAVQCALGTPRRPGPPPPTGRPESPRPAPTAW